MSMNFNPARPLLGVNVDHVASLRQSRGTAYPSPVYAALLAEEYGADGITVHLREDRRHIQEHDVRILKELVQTKLNLEISLDETVLRIAEDIKPHDCCLVPEKRAELTTEGGLDVLNNFSRIKEACQRLQQLGIRVSLFIDPNPEQISAAEETGAKLIELHTGYYAEAHLAHEREAEFNKLSAAVEFAKELGLVVNAGHGLNYHNVTAIANLPGIYELNIGHAIIAKAMFVGLPKAIKMMKKLLA